MNNRSVKLDSDLQFLPQNFVFLFHSHYLLIIKNFKHSYKINVKHYKCIIENIKLKKIFIKSDSLPYVTKLNRIKKQKIKYYDNLLH
jgi:hypothetical protein